MKQFHDKVIYQIYPRSFQDSDGDGIGDLKGILSRLDYLEKLGVDMIWLSPIYPSSGADNGYDVSDYRAIDPQFGTMEDFEQLVEEAKKHGIGIMMDMVFNHTSTEHEWFRKALAGDPVYRDYYIWKDPVDGKMPTNWESKFGGPVWQYDEKSGQYYLHLFDVKQADLNWENPAVRKECADIIRFWMDKGVRGFRFDVINLISKSRYEDDYEWDGRRFYTDGPRMHEFLQELNAASFGADPCTLTVGEMSSTDLENSRQYAAGNGKELDMVFSFHHLKVDYKDKEKWSLMDFDPKKLKEMLFAWQKGMQETDSWNALFLNCHDQPRSLSRFGDDGKYRSESAKALATMMHMMRGTPYIFQGEEIGMKNPGFTSICQYRDVESLNAFERLREKGMDEKKALEILAAKSRDDARTPVRWDETENSGFTTGTPWIVDTEDDPAYTARAQMEDPDSVWNHYRKLIALRKAHPVIQDGIITPILEAHPSVIAYCRHNKEEEALVVTNLSAEDASFTLDEVDKPETFVPVLSNWKDLQKPALTMNLRPYESIVMLRPSASFH